MGYEWGEIVDGRRQYDLHEGQSAVMRSRARFTFALAGTGGGKTVTGPLWMMLQIRRAVKSGRDFTLRPFKGMVLAPTEKILNRATLPTYLQTFAGTDLEGRYLSSKGEYRIPGIGTLFFLSGFVPEGVEGDQYDAAHLDEGGQLSRRTWVAIQGRTGMNQAPVLVTSTIYHLNWIKSEAIARHRAGDKNYLVVSWDSIANPRYPVEEYERAKATLPPALFGMRYGGVVPDDNALLFGRFDYDANVKPCKLDPDAALLVGCNFASNPLAWVIGQRRRKAGRFGADTLEIIDEMILVDGTTDTALDKLTKRYGRGCYHFFGDAAARTPRATAAASDYQVLTTDPRLGARYVHAPIEPMNPVDRIAATNNMLRGRLDGEHRLFISPECTGVITDLENRFRQDDWRAPDASYDVEGIGPASDALSFMVNTAYPVAQAPPAKVILGKSA